MTRASFPDGVISPTQYGERIKAAAVYLNVQQLVPEDRTAQALQDLFGAPLVCPASRRRGRAGRRRISRASITRSGRASAGQGPASDETGFRIAGSLQWLHTTSSQSHTLYRVGEARATFPRG